MMGTIRWSTVVLQGSPLGGDPAQPQRSCALGDVSVVSSYLYCDSVTITGAVMITSFLSAPAATLLVGPAASVRIANYTTVDLTAQPSTADGSLICHGRLELHSHLDLRGSFTSKDTAVISVCLGAVAGNETFLWASGACPELEGTIELELCEAYHPAKGDRHDLLVIAGRGSGGSSAVNGSSSSSSVSYSSPTDNGSSNNNTALLRLAGRTYAQSRLDQQESAGRLVISVQFNNILTTTPTQSFTHSLTPTHTPVESRPQVVVVTTRIVNTSGSSVLKLVLSIVLPLLFVVLMCCVFVYVFPLREFLSLIRVKRPPSACNEQLSQLVVKLFPPVPSEKPQRRMALLVLTSHRDTTFDHNQTSDNLDKLARVLTYEQGFECYMLRHLHAAHGNVLSFLRLEHLPSGHLWRTEREVGTS
eukprot:TRINITY_DN12536_c0_g1_i1.p1 TRINITY_DN12536_c0_g1~~TRINITY_DN12536_c0_g1_i1.p1  ORF type:complete len:418 (+),score=47.85 TRINITY_DN12536_c0_g1_i1:907-2160(+)